MDPRTINEHVSVAPQISVADVAAIKAAGFVAIVNNRPDDEEDDQPRGADIAAAAKAAGLAYHNIPIDHRGVSDDQAAQMRIALDAHEGPVFCFCRSGTRCAILWAKSQIGRMEDDAIVAAAAGAGYHVG